MRDKSEIFGIFLYEGFVSKRSPKRNTHSSNHLKELSFFLRAAKSLVRRAFDEESASLLVEIYDEISENDYLRRYYPYSLQTIKEYLERPSESERNIPDEMFDSPIYTKLVAEIISSLTAIESAVRKSFFWYDKSALVSQFNGIHNHPRFLFPRIQPTEEIPFMGLKLSEFDG
jgi:hypothetical protein